MDKNQPLKIAGIVLVVLAAGFFGFKSCASASSSENPEIIEQKNPSPPDSYKATPDGQPATKGESSDKM